MPKFILLLFLSHLLSAQGPLDGYLKGKGVLDLAPSFSFSAARVFIGAGNLAFDEPYQGQSLNLFAEYGLSNTIDLVATAAAIFTPTESGLQDGGAFLKYRPFYKTLGNAGKVGVILGAGATFPLTDYEPTANGALGQKAVTLPLKWITQWETPLGFFVNITGGYHFRLDKLSATDIEQVKQQRSDYQVIEPQNFQTLLLKAGFPAKHYYLDAWVEWQQTKGGNNYTPGVPDLAQSFGVSYTQVGGTVYYSDNGRSGFFVSGGAMLGGRNVGKVRRLTFGAVIKL